jgi:fructose-bisphosphate aldolase class II
MLARTIDLLTTAQAAGYGVLSVNVIGLEHAEAIVSGAEAARAPIILQISERAIAYRLGRVEPIGRACLALAESSSVPVALHLDHATTRDLCERAAGVGFSSVMFDGSQLDDAENIEETAAVAEWAHSRGMSVEGESGIVGGKDGIATTTDGMTDPATIADYVAATGVDALAIAIGSEHGMRKREATLDLDRLRQIRQAVTVPLVLHGSSGVPDSELVAATRQGITKINLATQLNLAWTGVIREMLAADPSVIDPRVYGAPARQAMAALITERCILIGAANRA